ncbi:MAG TPA: hypothetical protein VIS09_02005 [Streptomyces sp.]
MPVVSVAMLITLGEHDTRRLLTNRLVNQALVIARNTRTITTAF